MCTLAVFLCFPLTGHLLPQKRTLCFTSRHFSRLKICIAYYFVKKKILWCCNFSTKQFFVMSKCYVISLLFPQEKYHMMRFADLLKRNKKDGVSLETLSEAMSQLARIGQSSHLYSTIIYYKEKKCLFWNRFWWI